MAFTGRFNSKDTGDYPKSGTLGNGNRAKVKGSDHSEHRGHACKQDVGSIGIQFQVELAAQIKQLLDRKSGPGVGDVVNEKSGHQDQSEEAAHALQGIGMRLFHVEATLLIEAVGVLLLRIRRRYRTCG